MSSLGPLKTFLVSTRQFIYFARFIRIAFQVQEIPGHRSKGKFANVSQPRRIYLTTIWCFNFVFRSCCKHFDSICSYRWRPFGVKPRNPFQPNEENVWADMIYQLSKLIESFEGHSHIDLEDVIFFFCTEVDFRGVADASPDSTSIL